MSSSTLNNKPIQLTNEKSEKDIILDKIFWFKIILSLITGIFFGIMSLAGILNFLLFILILSILSVLFYKKVSNEDENDYQSEVIIEGLNVSIPLFLLSWIVSFTIIIG